MKVAMIGAGGIGGVHLGAYKMMPDIEVVAIADVDTAKAAKNAGSEKIRIYGSIDELLDSEKLDMVDICSPTYLHAEHAIKAMEKGIHVLCEKPISLNLKSAQEMVESSVKNNVFFMVAHVIRFWPEYIFLKKTYTEKTYRNLKHAVFTRISPRPSWSCNDWMMDICKSGRAPVDLHIHDTDFILYMLGRTKAVTAHGIEDGINMSHINTCFEYEGAYVEAEGAWYNAPIPFEMSFRAYFENTMLEFKDNRLKIYENGKEVEKVDVDAVLKQATGINIDSVTGYYSEIMYFIQCIRQNNPPVISTPQSSLESLEIVMKEIESARRLQRMVL